MPLLILAIMILMAFLVESLVEYLLGEPFNHFPTWQPYRWLLMYVAAVVGVVGALIYKLDLLYLLAKFLADSSQQPLPWNVTIFGTIITGLAIGRGANYLHDIVSKFFTKPT
jgi:hypothetical protein